ncbi:MAG: P1 family peptidase [Actinobacteria bacterium]|nr:P1 family peptidase [Actinomycetota bacterium]
MRARDLGIAVGSGEPGTANAITDVRGVRVGHTTLVAGDDVRTGVTVVFPHDRDPGLEPVFAGAHRLNGNGELTGLEWIRESGQLETPIALTNTHSVGVVRDALVRYAVAQSLGADEEPWSLPVVGETWDGVLNDVNGFHVRAEHVDQAIEAASGGRVPEGAVGGGTGMICHGFKGGIGTASRVLSEGHGGWTVGVLVQANHGARSRLRIEGAPVGRELGPELIPLPGRAPDGSRAGSIIVLVATSAPLLPHQCERLAQRAALGIARTGGAGENSSGDLILAWATGNRGLGGAQPTRDVTMLANGRIDPLFYAVIDATEEAILNALLAAETMTGRGGVTAHRLDPHLLLEVLRRYGVVEG